LTGLLRRLRHEVHQLDHVLRELVGVRFEVAAQRARGALVGAGRAAQAQVDAPRVQRLQRAELLGDDQRRMVRQHHAAGTDADGRGARSHVRQQHGRGRARDARHAVVLGQPVARVAQLFAVLRQRERVAERLRGVAALGDRGKVEDR
jgi:hypothetical protein